MRLTWHLEERELKNLKPYYKNPRKITKDGLKQLKSSFDEIGVAQYININTDGTILSGHARYQQLKSEKVKTIDVLVPDRELTDKECEAVIVRMNKNVAGSWDFDILADQFEFDDLLDWGFSTEELGVVEPEIVEGEIPDDEVPEVTFNTTVKGDIWLLGDHRVVCGDSTMIDDVEKLMNGEKADMVFTDPPYGINEETNRKFASKSRKCEGNAFEKIKGDENTDVAIDFCNLWLGFDVKKYVIWGGNYFCHSLEETAQWLIWDKRESDKERDMNSDCELAWVKTGKKSARIFRHKWKGIIKASEHGQKRVHPTQKPIALAEWCFSEYDAEGLIIDGFLGSGSTLIACEKTKRKCYGMELDEHYCDVIVERWQKYTGKKATLESSGETYEQLKSVRNDA